MKALTQRTHCPVCEGTTAGTLYSCSFLHEPIIGYLNTYYKNNAIDFSFFGDAEFVIEECLRCGCIYQKNILNDEYMEKFYDEWLTLPEETAIRQSHEFYKTLSSEMERISSRFTSPTRFSVLDFGAGWGEWSKMAQAFGAEVFALEVSEGKKNHLKAYGIKTISWEELGRQKFDFINTEQVFEHISEPYHTFHSLAQLLNDGGILKISVPHGVHVKRNLKHPDWFAERFGDSSLMPVQPLEHINSFILPCIDMMASRAHLARTDLPSKKMIEMPLKEILRPAYRFLTRKKPLTLCAYYQKM